MDEVRREGVTVEYTVVSVEMWKTEQNELGAAEIWWRKMMQHTSVIGATRVTAMETMG